MVMFPTLVPLIAALTVVLQLALPVSSLALSFTGKVVGVIDGDTVDVMHNGQAERIRLNGVDCPEKRSGVREQGEALHVRDGVWKGSHCPRLPSG